MKSSYTHVEIADNLPRLATLDLFDLPDYGVKKPVIGKDGFVDPDVLITRLMVPAPLRGKGIASRLLTEVCADADSERKTLLLEVMPYMNTGTELKRLQRLYARFGFEPDTLTQGHLWFRVPRLSAE